MISDSDIEKPQDTECESYAFVLKLEKLSDLYEGSDKKGGWKMVPNDETKTFIKDFVDYCKDVSVEVTNTALSKPQIIQLEEQCFGEMAVCGLSGEYNAGKTKVENDLTGSNHNSSQAHATEGLSIVFPKEGKGACNLANLIMVDTAGHHRPLTGDLIKKKEREIQLADNLKKPEERRYNLLRKTKEKRLNFTNEQLQEYEKRKRERAYLAAVRATIEKLGIEEFLKTAVFDVGDVFVVVVNEISWAEQCYINVLADALKEHNLNQDEEGYAKQLGFKHKEIHIVHNYKNTKDMPVVQVLTEQFIIGTFPGKFERGVTNEVSNTTPPPTTIQTESVQPVRSTGGRGKMLSNKVTTSTLQKAPSTSTTSSSSSDQDEDPEFIDDSNDVGQFITNGNINVYVTQPYESDVKMVHYFLGREREKDDTKVDVTNHSSQYNKNYIKELATKLASVGKPTNSPGFLQRLMLSIQNRLRTIFKDVGEIELKIDSDYNIVFSHAKPLELMHEEADTQGYNYIIKNNDPVLRMDITKHDLYINMIIDAVGLRFKLPVTRTGKGSIEKLLNEPLDDIIKNTNIVPGEFSLVIDTKNKKIVVFGERTLTSNCVKGTEKTDCQYYLDIENDFLYGKEDENHNRVILFKQHEDSNASSKTTMLRQDRGYGKFKYKYKMTEAFLSYRLDKILYHNIDAGSTIITLLNKTISLDSIKEVGFKKTTECK